jgi:flagellar biosynthesis component FlhA
MEKKDKKIKGIPKEIIKELDIHEVVEEKPIKVTAIVEHHQVKLPVPSQIKVEVDFKKGQKLTARYDKTKKQIIYQL